MGNPPEGKRDPSAGGAVELLRLAWPLILGNSFWALQIFIDRVLLGRAGGDQVGAALATALLFWTPMCLFQNTANYATTFVAQYTSAPAGHGASALSSGSHSTSARPAAPFF